MIYNSISLWMWCFVFVVMYCIFIGITNSLCSLCDNYKYYNWQFLWTLHRGHVGRICNLKIDFTMVQQCAHSTWWWASTSLDCGGSWHWAACAPAAAAAATAAAHKPTSYAGLVLGFRVLDWIGFVSFWFACCVNIFINLHETTMMHEFTYFEYFRFLFVICDKQVI